MPDYFIPEGFFDVDGDTLTYWMYSAATLSFGPGDLPMDGVSSLDQAGNTAANTPTNFAGVSGAVRAPCHPADLDHDGMVGVSDFLDLLSQWGNNTGGCPPDFDGDLDVGVIDMLALLAAWGPC